TVRANRSRKTGASQEAIATVFRPFAKSSSPDPSASSHPALHAACDLSARDCSRLASILGSFLNDCPQNPFDEGIDQLFPFGPRKIRACDEQRRQSVNRRPNGLGGDLHVRAPEQPAFDAAADRVAQREISFVRAVRFVRGDARQFKGAAVMGWTAQ